MKLPSIKLSRTSQSSLMLSIFFGVNTILSLFRQILIARTFGLSKELDAFNAANNIPDLLFSLISGGALAFALIPVLSEHLTKSGEKAMWKLFSNVLTIVFITAAIMSVIVAIFAEGIVTAEFGVAPGFASAQQDVVVMLMRLNLIATLIFCISGIVSSGLQARQHFLTPAIAPVVYNLGLIFGAVVLSGYFGITGLVYGTIIGAVLHLAVQLPTLFKEKFRLTIGLGLDNPGVRRVIKLMGPRLLTVVLIQIIFLGRDNLASRLQEGAVTALTYGWTFMQVPETLIGTAIGTAILPTLSELSTKKDTKEFHSLISRAIVLILILSLGTTAVGMVVLPAVVQIVFSFGSESSALLAGAGQAFLLGLVGHTILEIVTRTFYAQQDAKSPLIGTFLRIALFFIVAIGSYRMVGVIGIALADTISVTCEVLLMLYWLRRQKTPIRIQKHMVFRIIAALLVATTVSVVLLNMPFLPLAVRVGLSLLTGMISYLVIMKKDVQSVAKL